MADYWSSSEEEDAIIATCLLLEEEESSCKKANEERECWVRPWVLRRSTHGAYANLLQELASEDEASCTSFLRMNMASFNALLVRVAPLITKEDTNMREAISPGERLAVTLRYLASGSTLRDMQYLYRIPPCTLSRIVHETCAALFEVLKDDYLKTPSTEAEWEAVAASFYEDWQFPNCLGALDGKHIALQAPRNEGSAFYNYKGFHSIILLALVDAKYRFLYVDVGANGRSGDAGVFKDSSLLTGIEKGLLRIPEAKALPDTEDHQPMVIIGDDAFPLRRYLLKPYPDRVGDFSEDERRKRRIFDYRLSRARRCVEHAFGILVQRFAIFKTTIPLSPEKVTKLTLAAVALHNFLISNKDITYQAVRSADPDRDISLPSLDRASNSAEVARTEGGDRVRDSFKMYFDGVGKVDWQEDLAPRKS